MQTKSVDENQAGHGKIPSLTEGIVLSDEDQARVDHAVEAFREQGYAIITDFIDQGQVQRALVLLDPVFHLPDDLALKGNKLPAGGGGQTVHVPNLFAHTRAADDIAIAPLLLKLIEQILGHRFQISIAVGMCPAPGAVDQRLHFDDMMWPIPRPHSPIVANTLIALDDFTKDNGATRVVPGSHKWDKPVDQNAETVQAEMPSGSLLVWDGQLWHGGGGNRTQDQLRRSINLNYNLSWLRQQENQYLGIPRDTLLSLPERLQRLLGYHSRWGGVAGYEPLEYLRKYA